MALKYWLEYNDVKDVTHRLEINDGSFSGSSTEINGVVHLDYVSTENTLEALRGQGLRVELSANNTLTFDDLFTEEQQTFQVTYKRDAVIKFNGWLNPEGWFEDFVKDKWVVSFDCVDGLGFLSDLSFVEDATGNQISGKKTQLEILSLALIRTGLQQNINTNIDIFYTGLATTVDVLANVNVNTERYIKDDGQTITSCDEVLRDILEPYAACITSHNGEWFIYKPNQLSNAQTLTYFKYDYQGAVLTPTFDTLNIATTLGSNINGFYPHHISQNQKIAIKNSIGAYRINYKYGKSKSLIDNTKLCTDDNTTIDDWTINSNTNLTFPVANSCGITLNIVSDGSEISQIETNAITLTSLTILNISIRAEHFRSPVLTSYFNYQVALNDGADTYYYDNISGEWLKNVAQTIRYAISIQAEFIIGIETDALPVAGDLKIIIFTSNSIKTPVSGSIDIYEVEVSQSSDSNLEKEGEFHTFQRTTKPSFQVESTRQVLTGDNEEDNYIGALYQSDAVTPTSTWFRKDITEAKAVLQIMGEETMRMNPTPMKIFSGNVYGFIDYLSVITIDGISGLFMPLKYSCNTKSNVIKLELKQIKAGELTDIDYKLTYDYGNSETPTIQ